MKLYTIESQGLAHKSYFLSDEKEAAVIDPRRDCEVYVRLAQRHCVKIKYIFETHRNEDYAVGSLELQKQTRAQICHSKELNFKYGEHPLSDNEIFSVGNLKIKTIHTPGHTNESMCYAVNNNSDEPLLVFTGDTLFAGSVGRTDLYGKDAWQTQAEKLYDSLHEKLLRLGDGVVVFPGHGAGSVCGSEIGKQDFSSIGYEKKTNPYLKINKEAFVERVMSLESWVPPYFHKMEKYNLNGPPLLRGLKLPKPLSADEFEAQSDDVDS
ncbi:MAG: MBL fold metallo-hydrolase, partial [Candidatus Bathyarchaeota archaeon]|nr:MBL fold metallo-hydrolase [Candidatus Bathyarchaeum sp.]